MLDVADGRFQRLHDVCRNFVTLKCCVQVSELFHFQFHMATVDRPYYFDGFIRFLILMISIAEYFFSVNSHN